MKRILIAVTLLNVALSACTFTGQPAMDEPANSETSSAPQTGNFIPGPADSNLMRGEVYLDSTELLTLESFPLQFMLSLQGSLPTPCHQLRLAVSPPDAGNRIDVAVYSVSKPDEICIQIIEAFEVNVPLGSFPEGRYTLWVNGEMVAEFQS